MKFHEFFQPLLLAMEDVGDMVLPVAYLFALAFADSCGGHDDNLVQPKVDPHPT